MSESGDRRDHSVTLERLDGRMQNLDQKLDLSLKSILDKIDYTDNSAKQLVVLVRGELTSMQKDISRIESTQKEHHEAIDLRLTNLESFKNKLLGAVAFASIFASALTAGFVKLLG